VTVIPVDLPSTWHQWYCGFPHWKIGKET